MDDLEESFNSRPHKEVDSEKWRDWRREDAFNSRPHKEVDQLGYNMDDLEESFNSRPHKEVDPAILIHLHHQKAFNSRPHKEVDNNLNTHRISAILSTHDLTRRSTPDSRSSIRFYPIFQLTTSQGGRLVYSCRPVKVVTFQLTTSQGGRRVINDIGVVSKDLSTHDLTRRSTAEVFSLCRKRPFQLTTSQGGRQ